MTSSTDRTIQVADLIDRPGESRRIALAFDPPGDLELPLADVGEPLELHGVVESVVDGLLVRGTVCTRLGLFCARCLRHLLRDVELDVVELFAAPGDVDADVELDPGYEIDDGTLNLDTLLRDALVPAVPYRPLCAEDCAGLCPECGTDLNGGVCDCGEDDIDPRWAALADLDLPDA